MIMLWYVVIVCFNFFFWTGELIDRNPFVSGAGDLRFKSQAGQIEHSVATTRHLFEISSKAAVLLGCNDAEMAPANSPHAWA